MILLVDNRDSYTFNLAHLIHRASGQFPLVVPADEVQPQGIPQRVAAGEFTHVVISPGPGTPDRDADFAASRAVIQAADGIPVLGVCLGHQGLAVLAGAAVTRAPEPRHGFISQIEHSGEGIFAGIPQGFNVVRYHSLHIEETPGITVHARSEDGIIQGLEVAGQPHWGVQFHPESVLSEYGEQLVRNFLGLSPLDDAPPTWRLAHRTVPGPINCQAVVAALRSTGESDHAFWLDSADPRGRYSIIGDAAGTLSRAWRYQLGDAPDILAELETELAARIHNAPDLPFTGGVVGYLGYECAQLTLPGAELGRHRSPYPDAYFVRPQSWIIYDHETETSHLCCLHTGEQDEETERLLARLANSLAGVEEAGKGASISNGSWRMPDYVERVARAQEELRAGESYEVCLTDTYTATATGDLYPQLRTHNPAPYAAHLRFGELEVLSASPERFLTVRGGVVEAKPIKGTIPRAQDPAELQRDAKSRAENLMIVDLLRNDLGRVCEPGSVEVPRLMAVESFATVHQLVSTITGRLRADASLIDLIRATFPPGSMTGAPKLRTCEIIERLEDGPRGIYSGALGYLGFDGQADLSVVIRTAVRVGEQVTVGAGGAIVLASDPAAEDAEKQLKANAVLGAWGPSC
ncbi:chorismate-binding protein [Corynebacterium sp. CNCTC7651]|uniref:chorismate-binding protein n=1 Tax=Corynebacterium sp. CNCTC7651 TaxID=2815361 RepID=UPI001F27995D|nr:chorismate-binding protein [Corynebacterium sp. CNCTC7651]UIZ91528.1 chorismate-binding protein [Corynebacterium sp. CNCTC7651]